MVLFFGELYGFFAELVIRAPFETRVRHPESELGVAIRGIESHAVDVAEIYRVYFGKNYADPPHLAF